MGEKKIIFFFSPFFKTNKELDPVGPTVSYEVMKLCTGPVLTQYGTAILGTKTDRKVSKNPPKYRFVPSRFVQRGQSCGSSKD